jgi:general secretion pathway protein G
MNRQKGYTLIEIMVVVVILGILASLIIPRIVSRPEEARLVKAKQDVHAIESALELYKLDNGFYPSNDQDLEALVHEPTGDPQPLHWHEGGYLKKIPIDPWGKPYQYANPGTHGEIDVFTVSPKQQEIGNWMD